MSNHFMFIRIIDRGQSDEMRNNIGKDKIGKNYINDSVPAKNVIAALTRWIYQITFYMSMSKGLLNNQAEPD